MTETPATMTYDSIVYSFSVRLDMIITALNALEVKCGYVENAYITAPITEKVWSILGPKLRVYAERKAIIFRALYWLKSAGADFRSLICICMRV